MNLNKLKMNVVKTAGNGVVNHETIFNFGQRGNRVYAAYDGGKVMRGMLIGEITGSRLRFNYVQEHEDGKIASGESHCDISYYKDGRVLLVENFNWGKGKGRNVFMEL